MKGKRVHKSDCVWVIDSRGRVKSQEGERDGQGPNSQGGLGENLRTEIQGRTYSGREEKGSAAEGDRVEGSTEGGGRRRPGVSPGRRRLPGGGQGGPGNGEKVRKVRSRKEHLLCAIRQKVYEV